MNATKAMHNDFVSESVDSRTVTLSNPVTSHDWISLEWRRRQVTLCFRYLSCCSDKICSQMQLKEGSVILTYSSRGILSTVTGKT